MHGQRNASADVAPGLWQLFVACWCFAPELEGRGNIAAPVFTFRQVRNLQNSSANPAEC
jgi:hypothetical protein